MTKVELILTCTGSLPAHEFVKTFDGELNWAEIAQALKIDRCEMHPEMNYCDYD